MSADDSRGDVLKPPVLKRDWRFYSGMTALVLSVLVPLGAIVVPFLGLSPAESALVAGALLAGAPEVLCILAVALLGKETFQYFVHRAKGVLRAILERPASK